MRTGFSDLPREFFARKMTLNSPGNCSAPLMRGGAAGFGVGIPGDSGGAAAVVAAWSGKKRASERRKEVIRKE